MPGDRRSWLKWLGAGVLLVAAAVGGWRAAAPRLPSGLHHLVVISIDNLRADHLGAYGNDEMRTPYIDALAAEGIVFERHFTAAPSTLASHASLMTGRWPHNHGVPRNGYKLDPDNVTMAEVFAKSGFRTAAVVGGSPLDARSGLSQGFASYDDAFLQNGRSERRGSMVTRFALEWLDGVDTGPNAPPLFLFTHYFDVHAPYLPPKAWYWMYRREDIETARKATDMRVGSAEHIAHTRELLKRNAPGAPTHSRALEGLYKASVSYVDEQVGELLDGLRERQLLDRSLVVLTSDHGETMEDHPQEWWNHGHSVFDSTISIPLIVRLPGAERGGTRVRRLGSNVDVLPTVVEMFGLPAPSIDGESFARVLRGRSMPRRDPIFAEATKPWTPTEGVWVNQDRIKGVRTRSFKLVYDPTSNGTQLYSLADDPEERVNATEQGRSRRTHLRGLLDKWVAGAKPYPPSRIRPPKSQAEPPDQDNVDVEAPSASD